MHALYDNNMIYDDLYDDNICMHYMIILYMIYDDVLSKIRYWFNNGEYIFICYFD